MKAKFAVGLLVALFLIAPQEKGAPVGQSGKKVLLVPIDDEIDNAMAALVKRCVKRALDEKVDMVLLEIDTPGGLVSSTLLIFSELISVKSIPVVAYIRPMSSSPHSMNAAYSGGALVALSCKRIYMAPGSVIGAAAVVLASPGGPVGMPESIEEKYTSAVRQKFSEAARLNKYPHNLAIKMVDRDYEVYEAEVDGKKEYLTPQEIEQYERQGKKVRQFENPFLPKGKLLTLDTTGAVQCGIATRIIENRQEIYKDYWGAERVIEIAEKMTWSENFAGIITSQGVSMLLMGITILCIWISIKMGSIGTPAIIGLACLMLLFFGSSLAGLAEAPELVMIFLGIVLLAAEIFIFPGIAVAGILGVIFMLGGFLLMLIPHGFSNFPELFSDPIRMEALMGGVLRVLVSFVAATVGFFAIVKFLPGIPMFKKLVLQTELAESISAPVMATDTALQNLLHQRGNVISPLRPSGKIEWEGRTLDVITDGDFIERGEEVEIVAIEGTRIIVAKV